MNKMRTSTLVGMVLAIAHLLAFILFVTYLGWSSEGQDILLFTLWIPVDFPISLLVLGGFEVIPSDDASGSAIRRALPYFVHGVLGTVWWFYIPRIIAMVFAKFARQ